MTRSASIYALLDDNGQIRYIGYTIRTLEQRLSAHMRWLRRTNSARHLAQWLRSLGHPPTIILIEAITEIEVDDRERYWIRFYREAECDLVNATDGGKGTLGHKQSEEQIQKRVAKLKGHECTPEARAAISKANSGRKRTAVTRQRMSERKRGKPWTEAQRAAHARRYGPRPEPADPRFCESCERGPFRGIRGLHRHADNSPSCIRVEAGYGPPEALIRTPNRIVHIARRQRADAGVKRL